jgi:myo-inositol-1(or 4)-monophosphatase
MFFAERGKGAFLNGKRIKVTRESRLEDAMLGTGFYYHSGNRLKTELEIFKRLNKRARAVRRPGAAALDLAFLACGRYDGFFERGLSPWDVAAGFILVTEAGGKISDYAGKATNIDQREVLATNGPLHRPILKVIQSGG